MVKSVKGEKAILARLRKNVIKVVRETTRVHPEEGIPMVKRVLEATKGVLDISDVTRTRAGKRVWETFAEKCGTYVLYVSDKAERLV